MCEGQACEGEVCEGEVWEEEVWEGERDGERGKRRNRRGIEEGKIQSTSTYPISIHQYSHTCIQS